MVFAEFGTGQLFWSLLWLSVFFILLWLLMVILVDICLGSDDLSGWGKALWSMFVIFLPYLGAFVYLVVRGHKLHEHALEAKRARNIAQVGTSTPWRV